MAREPAAAAVPSPRQRETPDNPVFVLCGGRRTGSTLLQRLLISTKEILIWGEHRGTVIPHLMALREDMQKWRASRADPRGQLARFRRSGYNAWIPNMNPPIGHFDDGCRALLSRSFARPARALGYPRWGFKEVLYGAAAAKFLQALYPKAAFILLVRDPMACLKSIKSTQWGERSVLKGDPSSFMQSWAGLSEELLQLSSTLANAVLVRYEDLLSDTKGVVKSVSGVAGIPADRFQIKDVLEHKDGGPRGKKSALTDTDRRALDDPAVKRVARLLRY